MLSMKFTIAYYLLLLYVSVMLKPVIPIISDALSHTFSAAEHIATVHKKYGNNHLQKSMQDSGSENDTDKNQNTTKSQESIPVHLSTETKNDALVMGVILNHHTLNPHYNLSLVFILKDIPPPKFS